MESERETRFTPEVITAATDRINAVKEETSGAFATNSGAGEAVLDHFGWSGLFVFEFAESYAQQISEALEHLDGKELLEAAMTTALFDGMVLGGVAADVTYERSMGLVQ